MMEFEGMESVPDYLMSGNGSFKPVPISERAVTYEGLMEMLRRIEADPWGWGPEPVHPDVFEDARQTVCVNDTDGDGNCAACARLGDAAPCRQRETRPQAKTRVMLEHYSLEGSQIHDRDLWNLRAQYVWVKSYVQGVGGGLPYNTHNWVHFYNRYGSGGARQAVLMIGLRKDTVAEMARLCAAESGAMETLRILGH